MTRQGRPEIRVVDDVVAEAAALLAVHAQVGSRIALSGGSTPRAAYRAAAERQDDWSHAVLWFGDDRAVPADHEDSNFRMVRESLLDHVVQPRVERIRGELGAEGAALDYATRWTAAGQRLDLALMGLGPDAHTASLFPGKAEAFEQDRPVVAVPEPGMAPHVPRVSLTLPVFNAARRVVFLVTGADKADAMRRAFSETADPASPAAHVRPENGELMVICDAAAAAGLEAA